MNLKQLLDEWPRVKEEISDIPWKKAADYCCHVYCKNLKQIKTFKKFAASAPQNYDLLVQALGEAKSKLESIKLMFDNLGPVLAAFLSHKDGIASQGIAKILILNRDDVDSWLTKWGFTQEEER